MSFLYSFDNFSDYYNKTFGKSEEHIKYFGINSGTPDKVAENVKVLFYNKISEDFAVTLKTKEGDEIILYRTNDEKSFEEYYEDIENKEKEYTNSKIFGKSDKLLVPYVNVNGRITYEGLVGKYIKNTRGMYIETASQDVHFYLNENGCNLESSSTLVTATYSDTDRYFEFDNTFIIFMKEKDAKLPYFALKVDNTDILEKKEVNDI